MPLCPDSDDARKSPAFIMKLFLFLIVRKVIVHYSQQRYRGAEMEKTHQERCCFRNKQDLGVYSGRIKRSGIVWMRVRILLITG